MKKYENILNSFVKNHPAFIANIKLGWNYWPDANTLAYLSKVPVTKEKGFQTLTTAINVLKLFLSHWRRGQVFWGGERDI
jgi:hypothetical protein